MESRSEFIQKMQNGIFEGIHKTKEPYYQGLAEDIVKQRKRLGADQFTFQIRLRNAISVISISRFQVFL